MAKIEKIVDNNHKFCDGCAGAGCDNMCYTAQKKYKIHYNDGTCYYNGYLPCTHCGTCDD